MSSSPSPIRNKDDINMRDSIPPSRVLGVFGMSIFTRRDDLEKVFGEYGTLEKVELIYNRQTGKSKGFGFVYFERQEDAEIARLKTNGLELNERKIRVDFSRTESAHDPTPGFYNGKPIEEYRREHRPTRRFDDRDRDRGRRYGDDRDRHYRGDSDRHYAPRRRSRSRSRSNDRSYRSSRDYRNDRDREYNREDRRDYQRRRSPSPRN